MGLESQLGILLQLLFVSVVAIDEVLANRMSV